MSDNQKEIVGQICETKKITFLTDADGDQSAMRLGFLVGIGLTFSIVISLIISILICVFCNNLEGLKIILDSLSGWALLITSILTPLAIGKATQSYSENKGR